MSWYHVLPKDFSSKIGWFCLVVILCSLCAIAAYYFAAYRHTMSTLEFVMRNGSYIVNPMEKK